MSHYSTLIFDLSEVLIRGIQGVEKTLAPLLKRPERRIFHELGGDHLYALCEGKITERAYLQYVLTTYHWNIPLEEVQQHLRQNFQYPIAGMIALVSKLSTHYPLVLHSDHAREWVEYIRQDHPFLSQFTALFFSFDLGSNKDRPETFEKVLAAIHRQAEECLFIDDNAINIHTARMVGLDGIQFTGKDGLLQEFHRRNIVV